MVTARPITHLVVVGPECTGKTTLARELGEALGAAVVPEAARIFAEWHYNQLSAHTVAPIALLAMRLEEETAAALPATARPVLVLDTDLVSTVVYSRHYYGNVERWIADEARARLADLYLLCAPDIPWEPDGIRDRPDAREQIYREFTEELARLGARVAVVGGHGVARLEAALAAIRESGLIAPREASS
jgi:nicotinamide riboside kinase